jgi:hypothetical protein
MFQDLASEDIVALLTFPIAALFFAASTSWLNHVHRVANAPLEKKLRDLETLKQEAEQLHHSSTILLHGKKMREITKLEEEIQIMRRNRSTTRRHVILSVFYYLIQALGLVVVYFFCRKLAPRIQNPNFYPNQQQHMIGGGLDAFSGNMMTERPMEEIVMVPHIFTSLWIGEASHPHFPSEKIPMRTPMPILGQIRSLDFISWYICCLITVRVVYEGVVLQFSSAIKNKKIKAKEEEKEGKSKTE